MFFEVEATPIILSSTCPPNIINIRHSCMSTKKPSGSGLKYFGAESSGLRIQPKTVLIVSLIYIGIVVLLHIYAKLTAPAVVPSAEATDIPERPNSKVTE